MSPSNDSEQGGGEGIWRDNPWYDLDMSWADRSFHSKKTRRVVVVKTDKTGKACFASFNPFTWWNISIITSCYSLFIFLTLTKHQSVSFSWSAWLTFLLNCLLYIPTNFQHTLSLLSVPAGVAVFFGGIFKSSFHHHHGQGKARQRKRWQR